MDIVRLAQGADRVQVALDALKGATLTVDQAKQAQALLKSLSPTEGTPFALQSQACGRSETVDGHQAVVGKILINDQHLDTLLSEGSFDKTRAEQIAYAEKLGYRLATREEHLAYVDSLLEKEADGSINADELNALETHKNRFVRDTEGGLHVDGQGVCDDGLGWFEDAHFEFGALFVRVSAESK